MLNTILEQKHTVGLTTDRQKYTLENVIQYVQNPIKKEFHCKNF